MFFCSNTLGIRPASAKSKGRTPNSATAARFKLLCIRPASAKSKGKTPNSATAARKKWRSNRSTDEASL